MEKKILLTWAEFSVCWQLLNNWYSETLIFCMNPPPPPQFPRPVIKLVVLPALGETWGLTCHAANATCRSIMLTILVQYFDFLPENKYANKGFWIYIFFSFLVYILVLGHVLRKCWCLRVNIKVQKLAFSESLQYRLHILEISSMIMK